VLPVSDPLQADEPDAERFAAEMDLIKDVFNVLTLGDAVDRLGAGALPPRALSITFDDGYANNLHLAAPILAARGLSATFFVATGFIGGGQMWNDTVIEAIRHAPRDFDLRDLGFGDYQLVDVPARRRAVDGLLAQLKYLEPAARLAAAEAIGERAGAPVAGRRMMSETELRRLAGLGMELGAHSVTHPILRCADTDVARQEICESKGRLEEITRAPVRCFAYPNGRPGADYGLEHVQMVRAAGYRAAVSTAWGAAVSDSDRFQLPRVAAWDRTPGRYAIRLLRSYAERRPLTV
jgi:peptidoglycan/xylan/chitin deacetylase (PgdA/CDA1 family)